MAKFLNVPFKKFREDVNHKKIVLWGAGKTASFYIRTFCKKLEIISIIDKNKNLHGKALFVDNVGYPIIGVDDLVKQLEMDIDLKNNISIFITAMSYAGEIMKDIEKITVFDDINCYVGILMKEFCTNDNFSFTEGEQKIPKKIHYCWFGDKDIPDHLKKYMESWYKYCPDFKIIKWDENNYDISKNKYMREAYECKKWGFVPDYARLDIVYHEGGIYLDTDVEILAPLDKLLVDEMFCGFSANFQIGFGVGFGAIKGHHLIKRLRDYYDNQSFYKDDKKMNLKASYEYQNPVLEKFGFDLNNSFQKKDGVVIYPSEVLAPEQGFITQNYTKNTLAVHHNEYSWASEEERKIFFSFREDLKKGKYTIKSEI